MHLVARYDWPPLSRPLKSGAKRNEKRQTLLARRSKAAAIAASLLMLAAVPLAGGKAHAAASLDLEGKVFNAWTMRCSEVTNPETQAKVPVCEAFQQIKNQEGQTVFEVIVTNPPGQDGMVGAILTPLGVVLPAGIAVSIDGNAMGKLPYLRCVQQGCVGQFVFTDAQFASWKAGAKGLVTVVRGNGTEVALPLSLSGFTAATDAMK